MIPYVRIGIPSTAKIAGHPIHPMLDLFPIAFLIGALLSDIVYWASGDSSWARASAWLIGAGLAGGGLAAIAGLTDFFGSERLRSLKTTWIHFLGNVTAVLLTIVNLILRLVEGNAAAVLPVGIILSAIVVAVFAVTGWLGWELVYRYGTGLVGAPDATAGGGPASPRDRAVE